MWLGKFKKDKHSLYAHSPLARCTTFADSYQREDDKPRNREDRCHHWPLSCDYEGAMVRANSREPWSSKTLAKQNAYSSSVMIN